MKGGVLVGNIPWGGGRDGSERYGYGVTGAASPNHSLHLSYFIWLSCRYFI